MNIEGLPVTNCRRYEITIDGARYSLTLSFWPDLVQSAIRETMEHYPDSRCTGGSFPTGFTLERLS